MDESKRDEWINDLKLSDDKLKEFLRTWDGTGDITEQYTLYLQNNAKATSKWSTITKGAANIAKGFGAALASMGVNMLVGMALDAVISAISNFVRADEIAIERMEEAKSTIDELNNSYKEHSDLVKESGDRYAELSSKSGSLTTDELKELEELNNKFTESFPSLISGFDDQGKAISNIGTNAEESKKKLKELLEQEKDSANYKIFGSLGELYDGTKVKLDEAIKGQKEYDNFIQQTNKSIDNVKNLDTSAIANLFDADKNEFSAVLDYNDPSKASMIAESLRKSLVEFKRQLNDVYSDYNLDQQLITLSDPSQYTSEIDENTKLANIWLSTVNWTNEEKEVFKNILENNSDFVNGAIKDEIQNMSNDNDKLQQDAESTWKDYTANLANAMQSQQSFKNLNNEGLKDIAVSLVKGLDKSIYEEGQTIDYSWIRQNILDSLSSLTDDDSFDLTMSYQKLFKLDKDDLSTENQKAIDGLINNIAVLLNQSPIQVRLAFGFEESETQKNFNTILDEAKRKYQGYGKTNGGEEITNDKGIDIEKWQNANVTTEKQIKLWDKAVDSCDTYSEAIKRYQKSLEKTIGTSKDSKSQMIDTINAMSDGFDILDKIYVDVKDGNTKKGKPFDFTNLDTKKFEESFKGLEKEYTNFIETVSSSPNDIKKCQDAFDELVSAYIEQSGALDNLTDENANVATAMLKNMGVSNASKVVSKALAVQKAKEKLESDGVTNATLDEAEAKWKDKTASEASKIALSQLALQKINLNNNKIDTSKDIEQIENLAKKAGVATETLSVLAKVKNVFSEGEALEKSLGTKSSSKELADLKQSKRNKFYNSKKYKNAQKIADDIANGTYEFKFNPTKYESAKYAGSGLNNGKKDSKSKSSKTKEEINWLQRALDVIQKKLDTTASKLKNLFSVNAKNKNLDEQIKQINKQITAYEKVMSKYASKMKQADKKNVFYKDEKKNDDIIRKIKNGKLDGSLSSLISEYGSKRGKKINKYIEYYDNYLDAQQKLEEKEAEKREKQIEKHQNKVDSFDAQAELKGLESENSNDLQTKNKLLSDKISLVQKSYDEQIKIAQLEKDTTKELTLQKKKQQEIIDLKKQQYDNTKEEYDSKIELLENEEQDVRNQLDLLKAKGETVSESVYKDLIAKENVQLQKRIAERTALENVSKGMAVNSDEWKQAQQDLQSLDDSISDSQNTIVELNDSIVELDNSITEAVIANNENMKDESDLIANLIQDKDKFESGEFTKEGLATLGSYDVGLKSSQNSTEKYKADREELEKLLATGQYGDGYKYTSKEKLESAIADTIQKEQDAIQSVYDYESKIIDLMTEKYRSQIDYLNEIVQAKQEALDIEKDLYEYEKNIASKTKDVATIQKQIAALQGDNSEEGRAKRAKLQVELDNVVQDLKDTEYDKKISDQKEMLDNLSAEYEELITKMSKNRDELLKEGIKAVEDNGSLITDTWDEYTSKYNYDYSSKFGTIKDAINGTNGSLASVLQTQASLIISEMKAGNSVNSGNNGGGNTSNNNNDGSSEQKSQSSTTKAGQVANADVYKSASEKGMSESDKRYKKVADILSGSWFSGHGSNKYWVQNPVTSKSDIEKLSKVNKWIRSQKFFEIDGTPTYLTTDGLKRLAKKLGVSYSKDNKTGGIKDYLGFQTGGIIRATGVSDTGDKVLVRVNPNETILTQDFTKLLPETVSAMQNFVKLNIPDYSSLIRKNTSNANTFNGGINLNLELPNVQNANDFVTDLKKNSRARRAFEVAVNDISRNGHITEKITRV